jgi:hypothetical protein
LKKRAPKKTKKINYKRDIWESVFWRPGQSKEEICQSITGYRNAIFSDIKELIGEGILEEAKDPKGRVGLIVSLGNDAAKKHSMLIDRLNQFSETRDNTIAQIKERIEKSRSKSFFYQTEFTYTSPLLPEKVTINEFVPAGKEFETVKIYHINDEAKDWIFMIPHLIDQLIRSTFTLYIFKMLSPISDEVYKEIYEPTIQQVLKEIRKTKKMLLALVDKKDKNYFQGWWWQLTVGLELDTDPYPRPKDVKWTGKKI